MDFLTEGSIAGQTLLRLVSRASSIISELQRLSSLTPTAIQYAGFAEESPGYAAHVLEQGDPRAAKYRGVLFDFRYLKTPEMFDRSLNTSAALTELDEEVYDAHEAILTRFYGLFESIVTYLGDYNKYLRELEEGYYIQHTLEAVLLDVDGRQLLCEGLYLYGVMLLLLDSKIPGCVRERLIVAHYRHKGEGAAVTIVDLSRLCRDTGYRAPTTQGFGPQAVFTPAKRPANYPEEYLARFPVSPKVVSMILGRLRSDDIYGLSRIYPAPEDRCCALASQAPLIYVALYFAPRTLHENKPAMREIVDKHFSDNYVLPLYMGECVDLSVEWDRYKAAKEALAIDCLTPASVKALTARHRGNMEGRLRTIGAALVEGVLSEAYVVDNIGPLLELLRGANSSLRWALLHRRGERKAWRDIVCEKGGLGEPGPLLAFLLQCAQLEHKLKAHIRHLLAIKAAKWGEDRAYTRQVLDELSAYFSGTRALTRQEKDEGLQAWFARLSAEVGTLEYSDGVLAGRKMKQLVKALEDVPQFDAIDATPQVKEYIVLAKDRLNEMVRSCGISEMTLGDLDQVTDFSYAWELIQDFKPEMHAAIRANPEAVRPLRAAVLKLTSMMDVPLIRIVQSGSPDRETVAQYYSNELVGFLRAVMGVIPVHVFSILREVIALQSSRMPVIPVKLEASLVKDFAAAELRHTLAKKTHEISIFTEGVLAMEATLLGVIKVDPRAILTDGIRKHLVETVSSALHTCCAFDMAPGRGKDPKAAFLAALGRLRGALDGTRSAMDYVQDYIRLYGQRMWQEEYTRILGFGCEQESNRFARRKVLPEASPFQAACRAAPLPNFLRPPPGDASPAFTINFTGRVCEALLALTRPGPTLYGPGPLGGTWSCSLTGREMAGSGLFLALRESLSTVGLTALDSLLGQQVERALGRAFKEYGEELQRGAEEGLLALGAALGPATAVSPATLSRMGALATGGARRALWATGESLLFLGHAQLLRRALALQLRFSCRLHSALLAGGVEALNESLLGDVRRHYGSPERHALPGEGNALLPAAAQYCEAVGINDPLANVYLTPAAALQPLSGLWLTLVAVSLAPLLAWSRGGANLVRRGAGEPHKAWGSSLASRDGGVTQALGYPVEACLDGPCLVAGMVTLLKQLHPAVTEDFVGHMSQYIRASVAATVGVAVGSEDKKVEAALAGRVPTLEPNTYALLILLVQVAKVAHLPDRVVHDALPPFILLSLPV